MKYGLTRKLEVYGFDNQEADEVIVRPGDNVQASLWASKNLKGLPEEVEGTLGSFAWAYFAMRREGLLGKYDIAEKPTYEAIEDMTNKVSVFFSDVEDDSLPLAGAKQKTK